MRFRRVAATVGAAAVVAGGALALSGEVGSAATPPPTPIALGLTGMSSAACPLPLNGSMAVKPGTTVQFKPQLTLLPSQSLSLSYVRETSSTPKPAATTKDVPNAGLTVPFAAAATYDLSWHTDAVSLLGIVKVGATQTGKLVVDPNAKLVADQKTGKCLVEVQVPTPSVSASGVPDPVTSTVNGVVGGVVSGVNGVLNPINGVIGPIVGGVGTGLPIPGGGSGSGGSNPSPVPGVGTIYHPTGPTVAQRTVPQGYGNGSGVGGTYVPAGTGSGGSAAGGSSATGNSNATGQQPVKSGGSPKTVQLAADKPRSALDGWSALIVLGAVLALSGATAFYARSYLLHPLPAKVKS